MTPLLEALVAASKVGFDAPKCGHCYGLGSWTQASTGVRLSCIDCNATGVDAGDAEFLIGLADLWLHGRSCDVLRRWATNEIIVFWDVIDSALPPADRVAPELVERHDGTPAGLATALLRLVARVGAPKETA